MCKKNKKDVETKSTEWLDLLPSPPKETKNLQLIGAFYCNKCKDKKFFTIKHKKEKSSIKLKMKCNFCGSRQKKTLKCYDKGDLYPFLVDHEDICTDSSALYPFEVEAAFEKYYKSNLFQLHKNPQFMEFFRDWVDILSTYKNSEHYIIWNAMGKIKDDFTYMQIGFALFGHMWD